MLSPTFRNLFTLIYTYTNHIPHYRRAQAAVKHNLTGVFVDYEVGDMGGDAMAARYSAFLAALSVSMHGAGREAAMAVDKNGILRNYSLYARTGVDKMMTMATYNGWHAEPSFGTAGMARLTDVVTAELNASVGRSQLAVPTPHNIRICATLSLCRSLSVPLPPPIPSLIH